MQTGGIDIYNSRRGYFEYCRYWNRDLDTSIPLNILVHDEVSDGVFYAKEENSQYDDVMQRGNSFVFDDSKVTISTLDNVDSIKVNSYVLYQGQLWRVTSVQKRKIRKRSQFSVIPTYQTYLQLEV